MRVHLALLDTHGQVIRDRSLEGPIISVGEGDGFAFPIDDFFVEEYVNDTLHRVREVEILCDAVRAVVRTRHSIRPLPNPAEIPFGLRSLRITQYPRLDRVRVRGLCPKCGGKLDDQQIGGAYRSMARRERTCGGCGARVLTLNGAVDTVGRFSDVRETMWVQVQAPALCPDCLSPMIRRRLSTKNRSVEVERCLSCDTLVLDREDQLSLLGDLL